MCLGNDPPKTRFVSHYLSPFSASTKTIDCIQIIKNYRLYTNNKLVIHNRRTLENDWSIRIHLITQMVQCGLYVVRHAQSLVTDMQFDLFG
jgi:hypothetical protein